jgi:AcrR family transcriptional regulator
MIYYYFGGKEQLYMAVLSTTAASARPSVCRSTTSIPRSPA